MELYILYDLFGSKISNKSQWNDGFGKTSL